MPSENLTARDASPPAKDRKASLVMLGILDIITGLLCALMTPLMIFAYAATKSAPSPTQSLTLGMTTAVCAIYLCLAALAIWLGTGLILCRRWARAMVLGGSWLWLAAGLLGMIYMFFFMPAFLDQIAKQPNLNPVVMDLIKWFTIAFLLVIYVLFPGIHVLILSHPNVRDTCLHRDPHPRWTDHLSMPILTLVLCNAFGSLGILCMLFYAVFPFFGLILTGPPAMALILLCAAIMAWLTKETYLLRLRAWKASLIFLTLIGLSYCITFSLHTIFEFYESTNMPPEQLALLKQSPFLQGNQFIYMIVASVLSYIGYVVYCRKYFVEEGEK